MADEQVMAAEQRLLQHAAGWWREGRLEALAQACAEVAPQALAGAPDLAYWRALVGALHEQADALAALEAAHAGHLARGQAMAAALDAHTALVLCLLDVGAMERVTDWLQRAAAAQAPAQSGLWWQAGVVARQVLGEAAVPAAAQAVQWLHAQLRPLGGSLTADERLVAAIVLVNHHFAQQQYEQLDFIASLVEEPAQFERALPLMRARWCYTAGFAHYQVGHAERAEAQWRRAQALAAGQGLAHVRLMASLALLRLLLDRGRLDEAAALADTVQPQWGAGRITQLIELQQMRARLLLLRGQPAQALAMLQEALALAEHGGLSRTEQASCLTDRAQMLVANARLQEAQDLLAELAAAHAGRDAQVYRCLLALLQAWHWRERDTERCRRLLADGLERAQAARYTMFFRLLPALAAEVCALALREGIATVFVSELLRARALPAPPEADAHWPWPLWLRMLGGFELRLRGEVQQRPGKQQQKPLELLRLLACQRAA